MTISQVPQLKILFTESGQICQNLTGLNAVNIFSCQNSTSLSEINVFSCSGIKPE